MPEKKPGNWMTYMAWGTTISTTLAGLTGGGYFLGNYLDSRLGTNPWLKIVLIIAGLMLGIAYLVVSLSKLGKSNGEQ